MLLLQSTACLNIGLDLRDVRGVQIESSVILVTEKGPANSKSNSY